MKGFVVYPTYKIIENKAFVCLFGRLENGDSFITINEFKPYFYIKKEDLEQATPYGNFEHEETDMKTFDGKTAVKIIISLPSEVPKIRKNFEHNEIECFEADVRFPYRFMIDNGIQGSLEINGDYEPGERVDRVYKNPEITSCEYSPKNLKVFSFDIESGKNKDSEIYCISYICGEEKKVLMHSKTKVPGTVNFSTEKDLLEEFISDILKLDPDVITGWNVIDFDLDYLSSKYKELKIPFDIGREPGNIKIKIQDSFYLDSKAEVAGRQVLDTMHLMKVSFIKVPDYKLDTVASKMLGDGKLIKTTGKEKYKEIDELWKNDKKRLAEYNLKDSELVLKIIEKTNILELTIKRSLLTGMPLDRVNASIASLDSLYIREANKRKIICPTGNFIEKDEPIKGGYVREGEPGIYDYILVLDFKSLYPSIIRTFNIDPYCYVKNCKGKNLIKAPNGVCFRNEDGILPSILKNLYNEREISIKNKDELTKYAIKILSNSFFGVLGNPSCRFFDMGLVNSITYFGQEIIKMTSMEIEKMGYKVIYNDTDSNFLISKAKDLKTADKIGNKIEDSINDYYKNYIKKEFNRKSFLELKYEKCYLKFLMPKLRGREEGAKKRYAGLVMKNGKEEIQFTGLEAVRGDWTDLAKKFQNELLDKIFHNEEVVDYVKKFVKILKSGKYDDLLVYRKSIRKELKGYTKTTPPHVKAARKLKDFTGTKVEYLITEDGPEPIQNLKHSINYKHYIDKQIKPIADSVLVFFNTDFEDLINDTKQKKLFDY